MLNDLSWHLGACCFLRECRFIISKFISSWRNNCSFAPSWNCNQTEVPRGNFHHFLMRTQKRLRELALAFSFVR